LEPVLRKKAERVFMSSGLSNCQQLLNVFINESTSEVIKDFVVNRNPEFAVSVIHHKTPDEEAAANQRAETFYLKKLREELKTVNLIKF